MMLDERYTLFRLCARTCNFTQAGQLAYRTQSAVSQSIAQLEAELGTPLFHRDRRTLRLTEAGHLLSRYCEQAEGVAQSFAAELDALRGMVTGEVRIAASSTTACYWLPPPLSQFRAAHPGVRLQLLEGQTSEAVRWLLDGECDLAVVTLPASDPRLELLPFSAREDVLICAPGSPHLRKRPPVLPDLDGVPFVWPHPSTQSRAFLDEVFLRFEVKPAKALEVRGLDVIQKYVEQDFGVSVVPRRAVEGAVARGRLELWPLFQPQEFRRLAIALPSRRVPSPAVRLLVSLLSAADVPGPTSPEPAPGSANPTVGETRDQGR